MPLIFEVVFSIAVISQIESIYRGRGLGGKWRQVGSHKASIQTQRAVLCHHRLAQLTHREGQVFC